MTQDDRAAQSATRRGRKLLLLGAAVVALGAVGWADFGFADGWHGRGMGPFGGGPGMMGTMMFDQLDADGDGRVARAEMESFRAERLRSADRNGDGRLDQAEFETFWLEVTRPMRVRAFQFLDADGDGIVTAAEIQRPSDRMFARMDRDGDGFLTPVTPAERERMRERMREEHRERGPRRD
ncbi:MAG: hypothetical protein KatS3mg117_0367 [Geminicoccaceae bacterium]|nr:MAG: hypothetical protein KatS3mg117_0367 [Geminicoccaceae bacterium]